MVEPATTYPSRNDRQRLLQQQGLVVWLTGLSGSGKTTLARALQIELHRQGKLCAILDGDQVRAGLNSDLGFSEDDRTENIRRLAEVAKVLVDTGVITIVAAISPGIAMRAQARSIIGESDFFEVFLSCPLEVCQQRDVKGLYKKAALGQVAQFTGVSAPYEPPTTPSLVLPTDRLTQEQSLQLLLEAVQARTSSPNP